MHGIKKRYEENLLWKQFRFPHKWYFDIIIFPLPQNFIGEEIGLEGPHSIPPQPDQHQENLEYSPTPHIFPIPIEPVFFTVKKCEKKKIIGIKEVNELASPPTSQSLNQQSSNSYGHTENTTLNEEKKILMPKPLASKEYLGHSNGIAKHSSDEGSDFSDPDEYGSKGKESFTARSSRGLFEKIMIKYRITGIKCKS